MSQFSEAYRSDVAVIVQPEAGRWHSHPLKGADPASEIVLRAAQAYSWIASR